MVPPLFGPVNGTPDAAATSKCRQSPQTPVPNTSAASDGTEVDETDAATSNGIAQPRGAAGKRKPSVDAETGGDAVNPLNVLRTIPPDDDEQQDAEHQDEQHDDDGDADDAGDGDYVDDIGAARDDRPHAAADEFVGSVFQPDSERRHWGIYSPDWAIRITRTKAELLVLSQLAYWFGVSKKGQVRAKIQLDGYYWVAKTYKKLAEDTHLRQAQTRGAIRSLTKRGLLVSVQDKRAGNLVRYRLNPLEIAAAVEAQTSATMTYGGRR